MWEGADQCCPCSWSALSRRGRRLRASIPACSRGPVEAQEVGASEGSALGPERHAQATRQGRTATDLGCAAVDADDLDREDGVAPARLLVHARAPDLAHLHALLDDARSLGRGPDADLAQARDKLDADVGVVLERESLALGRVQQVVQRRVRGQGRGRRRRRQRLEQVKDLGGDDAVAR